MASFDPVDLEFAGQVPRPTTPPVRMGFLWVLLVLTAAALVVYGTPYLAEQVGYRYEVGRSRAASQALQKLSEEGILDRSSALFRMASTRVQPAVVNVRTFRLGPGAADGRPGRGVNQMPLGSGSGVVIDNQNGYIVTNQHVVRDADAIAIRLGRREMTARLVGADPKTDLAVLQVSAELATAATWGDSDRLDNGDWVLAIGSPFELDRTVTAGIVSATGRADLPMFSMDFYQDFVQTDAAINPGNSGGPLINLQGEVVGINTAIFSETGGYQGIGLAISSNLARKVVDQLIKEGRVIRGYLGISMRDVQPDEAETLKIPPEVGVLVNSVVPGSPADRAGLRPGDVILDLAGEPVPGSSALRNRTVGLAIRQEVPLTVLRDGAKQNLKVTIQEMPILLDLGLLVQELPPDLARQLPGNPEHALIIEGVIPGSPAARAGLIRGLRITGVKPVAVETLEQLNQIASARFSPQQGIDLQIETPQGAVFEFNVGGPNPGPRQQPQP